MMTQPLKSTTLLEHENISWAYAFSPSAHAFAWGTTHMGHSETLYVADLNDPLSKPQLAFSYLKEKPKPSEQQEWVCHLNQVSQGLNAVAWHPSGKYIATGAWRHEGGVRIWALSEGHKDNPTHTVYRHNDNVSGVAFSKDGAYLLSTSMCYDKRALWMPFQKTGFPYVALDTAQSIDDSLVDGLYGYTCPRMVGPYTSCAMAFKSQDKNTAIGVYQTNNGTALGTAQDAQSAIHDWWDAETLLLQTPQSALAFWKPATDTLQRLTEPLPMSVEYLALRSDKNRLAVVLGEGPIDAKTSIIQLYERQDNTLVLLAETKIHSMVFGLGLAANGEVIYTVHEGCVVRHFLNSDH